MKLTTSEKSQLESLFEGRRDTTLVIVDKSDAYPAAHFRLAILLSLTVSMFMYFVPWSFSDPVWYLYAQVPALIIGYMLASRKFFKRFFTTNSEMSEETYQKALEIYYENKLTNNLLFISLLEKKVHLINSDFDEKINKDVKKAIAGLTSDIKKMGLYKAVENYLPKQSFQESLEESPREVSLSPQTTPSQ